MSGNFSSSGIWALTKLARNKEDFGAPALKYIKQKRFELKLGRYLSPEVHARPLDWGNICEPLAFDRIGMGWKKGEYRKHFEIDCWSEYNDIQKDFETGDIKSPYTLESFCNLYEALSLEDDKEMIEALKALDDGYKYYWQLISSSVLFGVERATLAIFLPYKRELKEVREQATKMSIAWLNYMDDEELPYLIEGNDYENILERSFEVPKEDQQFLTEQVRKAEKLLKS